MTGSNAALPAHVESGDLTKIQAGRARQSCLLCNSRLTSWLLGTHLGGSVISLSLRSLGCLCYAAMEKPVFLSGAHLTCLGFFNTQETGPHERAPGAAATG